MSSISQVPASQVRAMLAEATARHHKNDIAMAEALYREVLKHDPQNFDALHMLAVVGYQTEHVAPALELFEKAYNLRPNDFSLLVNYGAALKKANRCEDALVYYDKALAQQPNSYEALFNKAQSLLILGRSSEAEEFYRRSLALNDRDPEVHNGLGKALYALGDMEGAVACIERGLAVDPKFVLGLVTLALIFLDREWFESARLLLERAAALEPRNAFARSHYSFVLLRTGNFAEGWKSYEMRFWYSPETSLRRPVPPMYWDGEELKDKVIHVWPEQGIGDEIMFSSMLPEVIARAKRVYLECEPRLVDLFRRSFPQAEVYAGGALSNGRPVPSLMFPDKPDFQTALPSLAKMLRPTAPSFPASGGYLRADPAKVAQLRARYGPGPLVGVSWRSSMGGKKTSRIVDWGDILKLPGLRFVDLQYGETADELAEVRSVHGVDIVHDPDVDQLKDMDSFAAQVAAMDLVITTSNTAAHVAGALGKPTWLMLPRGRSVHWYWFRDSERVPWYPSVKAFRQTNRGDWSPVFQRVTRELEVWSKERRAS